MKKFSLTLCASLFVLTAILTPVQSVQAEGYSSEAEHRAALLVQVKQLVALLQKLLAEKEQNTIETFSHPVSGAVLTRRFTVGTEERQGVNFSALLQTEIKAAAAGKVTVSKSSGWNTGYGNYIVIEHADDVKTLYAHLSETSVRVGDIVERGQVIGSMGNSGRTTGPQGVLTFEVWGADNPF